MNEKPDCLKDLREGAEGFYFSPRIDGKKIQNSPAGDHRIVLEAQRTYLFGPYPNEEVAAQRFRELYPDDPNLFALIFPAKIVPSVVPQRMQEMAEREARKVPAHPDNHDGDKCRLCGGALAKSPVDYMGDVEVAGRRYARFCPKCEQALPGYGGKISGEQYERETDIPEYLYLKLLPRQAEDEEADKAEARPGFLARHGIFL
jgi:hypothetical protein